MLYNVFYGISLYNFSGSRCQGILHCFVLENNAQYLPCNNVKIDLKKSLRLNADIWCMGQHWGCKMFFIAAQSEGKRETSFCVFRFHKLGLTNYHKLEMTFVQLCQIVEILKI